MESLLSVRNVCRTANHLLLGSLLLVLPYQAGCSSTEGPSAGQAGNAGAAGAAGSAGQGGAAGAATGGTTGGGAGGSAGSAVAGNAGQAGTGASGGSGGAGGSSGTTHEKRIIGYVPDWNQPYSDWADQIDFSRVTHLNLAFANPQPGTNNITIGAEDWEIAELVDAAHENGVKVLVSVAGGAGSGVFVSRYGADNVDAFVVALEGFMNHHNLDGIDVDVEQPGDMGEKYGVFLQKLEAAIKPDGKLLTAAVARWIQDAMPDDALHRFDFINVMSYDHCGSWTDACPHAGYDGAVEDMNYYANEKQVPKDKIVLGVPFYGYCWGGNCDSDYMLYKDILNQNPDAWQSDTFTRDQEVYWYNGEETMAKKAALAQEYGGAMIWELTGDAEGERSLLGILADNL